ncbi:hypothetical protein SDC9_74767 [bioreactor metagenome]|uniref:Uncharacterized protein n=1 Tax=bioreactor metagenome TaxID=1076179 RepID=A0A644YIX5_9ZZZZ
MVARHSELPPKYLFLFGVFMFIPVLVMVILISVFSGGKAHGIPYEFAVDSEQRIYMSFNSGLYVVDNGRFIFLLSGDKGSYALSVSDDDMLTIADPLDIRIVDLAKSDLTSGHLEVVQKTRAQGNALYDIWIEDWKTDPQNGTTYRMQTRSNYYEILREDANGTSVFFTMPHSDYVWGNVVKTYCALVFVYFVGGFLVVLRYTKKHPEAQIHLVYPWHIRRYF